MKTPHSMLLLLGATLLLSGSSSFADRLRSRVPQIPSLALVARSTRSPRSVMASAA
jgi:hypothetical protein